MIICNIEHRIPNVAAAILLLEMLKCQIHFKIVQCTADRNFDVIFTRISNFNEIQSILTAVLRLLV